MCLALYRRRGARVNENEQSFPSASSAAKNSLENFRPGERDYSIHNAARGANPLSGGAQDDFFMNRIQGNSRSDVARDSLNRNLPTRGNVTLVHDAPGANRSV